jgi:hypothetical protein
MGGIPVGMKAGMPAGVKVDELDSMTVEMPDIRKNEIREDLLVLGRKAEVMAGKKAGTLADMLVEKPVEPKA